MLQIGNQAPSDTEIKQLLGQINQSPYITGMSRHEMNTLIEAGRIHFGYANGNCVGFGAWLSINVHWVEAGPFFLLDEVQGRGYGRQIFDYILSLCNDYHIYGVTKNPAMKYLMQSSSFRPVSLWQLPPIVYVHLLRRMRPLRTLRASSRLSSEPLAHYIKK